MRLYLPGQVCPQKQSDVNPVGEGLGAPVQAHTAEKIQDKNSLVVGERLGQFVPLALLLLIGGGKLAVVIPGLRVVVIEPLIELIHG